MTSEHGNRFARSRFIAAAMAAVCAVSAPSAGHAVPGGDGPETQRERVGRGAEIELDVDVFNSQTSDVTATLGSLDDNVREQLDAFEQADAALRTATSMLERADRAVNETEGAIESLSNLSDQVVVEAFVSPPTASAAEALTAGSPSDATVKQSILDRSADHDADVLVQLAEAEDDLVIQKAAREDAAAQAEQAKSDAEVALADFEAAQSQQAAFILEVQQRLDQQLSEAEALAELDPAMARRIKSRQAEIVRALAEIREAEEQRKALAALKTAQEEAARRAAEAAARASSMGSAGPSASGPAVELGPASGRLSTVPCPAGGSITIDSSLAGSLRSLLGAAAADGFSLCGGGYRDPADQVALRRANCGSSHYAIYEAPSSYCSPPTARPGTSMHEQGLAIDFTCNGGGVISGRGSACYQWLAAHAGGYGLYNLPSEPWHWSTDGT